jgi:hypothetical protein
MNLLNDELMVAYKSGYCLCTCAFVIKWVMGTRYLRGWRVWGIIGPATGDGAGDGCRNPSGWRVWFHTPHRVLYSLPSLVESPPSRSSCAAFRGSTAQAPTPATHDICLLRPSPSHRTWERGIQLRRRTTSISPSPLACAGSREQGARGPIPAFRWCTISVSSSLHRGTGVGS